jgi:mannose-6-phosphate isomerase-like protein (cupin superfamily)
MLSHYGDAVPYTTKDGTLIRELMHPRIQGNRQQSLAETELRPGQVSALHRHRLSEEIYHIAAGEGEMTLGRERITVGVGDSICIPPGTPHCIRNTGAGVLRILCCSSPAYAHEDTELA